MKTVKITEKQLKSLKTYLSEICHDEMIPFKALAKIGLTLDVSDDYDNDLLNIISDEYKASLQNFFLVNDMDKDAIMQINIFDVEKFIHINGSNAYEANYSKDIDELRRKKNLYDLIRAYRDAIKNIRKKGKTPKIRTFQRMYYLKQKLKNM